MEMEGVKLEDEKLIDQFLNDCKLRGIAEGSMRSYKSPLKIFSIFLNGKNINLQDVNRNTLREYVDYLRNSKKLSQKTIENHFSALSSFYEYLVYEQKVEKNIVLDIRRRYLRRYKKNSTPGETRKLISVEEMAILINSILDARDKAIAILFAKTGIRREELVTIDVGDINWGDNSITLKPSAKRSNRTVFFDGECAMILRRWLQIRKEIVGSKTKALFTNGTGERLKRSGVYNAMVRWAKRLGYFDPNSDRLEDHFSCHNFRHWFTTHLLRNGMPREYVKELRGDIRGDAIDIYHHIDKRDLRKSYLSCIPKFNVY
jgi:integrase/recombinase XerD